MSHSLLWQHLFRAWRKHWALQMASVTVMTLVLVMLNFMFLGYSAFNKTVAQWGRGLEMIVYVKEGALPAAIENFTQSLTDSGEFEQISFTTKAEATKRFLTALGPDSLELLNDPKWSSPIPASLELRLSNSIAPENRIKTLEGWSAKMHGLDFVEEVFYGQGWIENFQRFLGGARGVVALFWILSLSAGLLIVGNCIRLSFLQRREEIEVMELVGATTRFVRTPFLLEGVVIGLVASLASLGISYGLHSLLLAWLGDKWNFWIAVHELAPLQPWFIAVNLLSGLIFGGFGAWNCVRKLNTGWSAAAH
jgi:cell division transport system permease protein